ncbi:MAG: beta-N-acetylhexosaminidase [Bdellovibrionales bacterium]|nr:beta-N-acetylhexosaminidase [Bdellovibrionales bacterium]
MLVFILLFQYFTFATEQSIEEKVGQLFIIGINGKSLTSTTKEQLDKIKPGGVILFRHNISSPYGTYKLNASLQAWANKSSLSPLLIGVDQEGGVVNRIKTYPKAPSAAIIGKQLNTNKITDYASALGNLLYDYGFNLNFAPVLDQTTANYGDFIGTRSFSPNMGRLITASSAFAKGLKSQGVLTVGKHFPGHGRISVDSHVSLPKINLDADQLTQTSAKPFIHLYKNNLLDAVMVGHLSFPKIDSSSLPATFSRPLLTGYMRDTILYQGLIITDDIEMKAAGISERPEERAVLAIEAGADMIMVAWNPKSQLAAYKGILDAVKSGRITIQRINESINRIQTAKSTIKPIQHWTTIGAFKNAIQKIPWAKAVTAIKLPDVNVTSLRTKLSVYEDSRVTVASADPAFLKSYSKYNKILIHENSEIDTIEESIDSKTLLVYHSTSPKTYRLLSSLSPKLKSQIIVINSSRPEIQDDNYFFVANFFERSKRLEGIVMSELKSLRSPASNNH